MSTASYRHTQVGWIVVVIAALVSVLPIALVAQSGDVVQALLIGLPILLIVGNLTTLTTWVEGDEIGLRFGLGLYLRRIDARTVRHARVAEPPALSGIGIRLISGGWLYNVGSDRVVELDLEGGRRVMIGTNEPEALLAAIATAMPDAAHRVADDGSARHLWRVALAAALLLLAGVLPVVMGMRPVHVDVSDGALHASGGFYRTTVPLRDIVQVTVLDTLPAIDARTNGFAAGGRLRGHFSLRDYGRASLFVDRSAPPFIMIRTRDDLVVVGTTDPAETRALAGRLVPPEAGAAPRD
ncbi:MAG TPA: hypothetical protein VG916_11025 [Gemmatimonadaceae bacterium]|nr:hypothetical protein [Gemmatimonadaceae bacterium]